MSTLTVNTHEAKSRLSELIRLVENGDEVFVARNGVTVVQIVPISVTRPKRIAGLWKGKMAPISTEEWAAADQEILAIFEDSFGSEAESLDALPLSNAKRSKAKK